MQNMKHKNWQSPGKKHIFGWILRIRKLTIWRTHFPSQSKSPWEGNRFPLEFELWNQRFLFRRVFLFRKIFLSRKIFLLRRIFLSLQENLLHHVLLQNLVLSVTKRYLEIRMIGTKQKWKRMRECLEEWENLLVNQIEKGDNFFLSESQSFICTRWRKEQSSQNQKCTWIHIIWNDKQTIKQTEKQTKKQTNKQTNKNPKDHWTLPQPQPSLSHSSKSGYLSFRVYGAGKCCSASYFRGELSGHFSH